jgi:cell fate (sporulation/competence/biofilm development) regulator YlbF (YheA/YmcA/DUF963 family)
MKNVIGYDLKIFIDAVKKSKEYLNYQIAREKVRKEPEKERIIHEYRKRNYLLQNQREGVNLFNEIDRLNQDFAVHLADPLMEEYISAEVDFCRLLQFVSKELMSQLDFDLGFMLEY